MTSASSELAPAPAQPPVTTSSAFEIVEDGIDTFRSTRELRWLAADLHRERNPDEYRRALKRLFLDRTERAAYDDLKEICDDQQWRSMYEEFERRFEANDRQHLIAPYVHDGELQKAFSELQDSENLSLIQ